MRIAFVGKGGSGKTTTASLFARYLASLQSPVLAIDADINQHLAQSLGLNEDVAKKIPHMGLEINRIKDFLRGANPRISAADQMIKTTPPGNGSSFIIFGEPNPITSYFSRDTDGISLMVVGPFTEEDLGVKCYHSKTGAVELFLNHLIDRENQYVVIDMTAGSDSFASGLFTRFDLTCLVVEPTIKSLSVYKQYKAYAKDFGVTIKVVGNKIFDAEDEKFVRETVGNDLIGFISHSSFVKSMERGQHKEFSKIEKENLETLANIQKALDETKRDWKKYYEQAVYFHKKNADGWANEAAGIDLKVQIDPNFAFELIVN